MNFGNILVEFWHQQSIGLLLILLVTFLIGFATAWFMRHAQAQKAAVEQEKLIQEIARLKSSELQAQDALRSAEAFIATQTRPLEGVEQGLTNIQEPEPANTVVQPYDEVEPTHADTVYEAEAPAQEIATSHDELVEIAPISEEVPAVAEAEETLQAYPEEATEAQFEQNIAQGEYVEETSAIHVLEEETPIAETIEPSQESYLSEQETQEITQPLEATIEEGYSLEVAHSDDSEIAAAMTEDSAPAFVEEPEPGDDYDGEVDFTREQVDPNLGLVREALSAEGLYTEISQEYLEENPALVAATTQRDLEVAQTLASGTATESDDSHEEIEAVSLAHAAAEQHLSTIEDMHHLTVPSSAKEQAAVALQGLLGKSIPLSDEFHKDDLKLIAGVGPFIEKKLNGLGLFSYKQIAALDHNAIQLVTEAIEFFPGRIERDNWVGQAQDLWGQKQNGYI